MPSLRDQVTTTALDVVGRQGIHALSHARVDAAAGLPRGSTSNYFRSRAALLSGVVAALVAADHAAWQRLHGTQVPSTAALTEALAAYVQAATTTDRVHTIARYTLFMEAMVNDQIRPPLQRARRTLEELAGTHLAELGATDPAGAAAVLLPHLDGMIMYRLAFSGDARTPADDPRPAIGAIVDALLR
ncbi:MAG TPA: hypothetical protein VK095_06480 [Beutenbergiaceae bacterium]|nr:hypothetical protein [Beutenbergiaceae bacterium]